ncbi:hypothetical protein DSO57_1022368 [Entomophthora muscae]|uniref:Uncharacterized protein n=1 Tax=Entomophthora muscae TaxID=34485 RepID=A0ACC2UDZ7_9FUNG|nr:hypothetical protein DSO57_1022368 [Entomophthora muscae]
MKTRFYLLSSVLAQHYLVLDGDCVDETITTTNWKTLSSKSHQRIDGTSYGFRSLKETIHLDENLFWTGPSNDFTKFHQEMQIKNNEWLFFHGPKQIHEKVPCYDGQTCTITIEWDGKRWNTTFGNSWNVHSSHFMYVSQSVFTQTGSPATKFSFTFKGPVYATLMENKVSLADGHVKKRFWGFFGTLFGYNLHYRKQNILLPKVYIPDVLFNIKYEVLPIGQSPT